VEFEPKLGMKKSSAGSPIELTKAIGLVVPSLAGLAWVPG
jgi:hypothetical protein